jgi:ATP-binding cassette subfamily F protein uup
VKALSGGECNRLLLARLFSRPANLLVMDEPTNDLDIETLELLEALLSEFKGTLLLVSHDRQFIDDVVTSTLVFEGNGHVQEYIGGYQDWLRQRKTPLERAKTETETIIKSKTEKPKKLSFKEQRELDELPAKIEKMEMEKSELEQQLANPDFYKTQGNGVAVTTARLHQLGEELERLYHRWQELEKLVK